MAKAADRSGGASADAPEPLVAAVIGAGPAGLAAAEALVSASLGGGAIRPVIFEAKPSAARKFLMAGKSGLNITKAEPARAFRAAFANPGQQSGQQSGGRSCGPPAFDAALAAFGSDETIEWAEGLGEPLFTGSSGRVFPKAMKASPLLRRWMARLEAGGAALRTRWRWSGWAGDALVFDTPAGRRLVRAEATVLALGGGSWPRLGADGAWARTLAGEGVEVAPFRPANMGFDVDWSAPFRARFAGAPVKPAALRLAGPWRRGEFVVTEAGVEGGLVYALSAEARDALEAGEAALTLDLIPDLTAAAAARRLARPRGKASLSNHLRKTLGLTGVRAGLFRELAAQMGDEPGAMAAALKALRIPLVRPRPLEEAISSAGGIRWPEVDETLMLRARPGVFAAGEMLDWEAPTGGYLITACLATGRHAGAAAARWLRERRGEAKT